MIALVSLGVGLAIGGVLALGKLPVAAPPTLAGVLGVVGISFGYWLVSQWVG